MISELGQLQLNWARIFDEAPADIRKTAAVAVLRSPDVKPVAIDGDIVVLAAKYDFYKDQLEQPEKQKVAEKIISGFLGRACRVRCVRDPSLQPMLELDLVEYLALFNDEADQVRTDKDAERLTFYARNGLRRYTLACEVWPHGN